MNASQIIPNAPRKINRFIWEVGARHPDRKLFDELIPLPWGTSYNSYLILGNNKTALIDTVDPVKKEVLFDNLDQLNIKNIDYVIANHAEQDHSGSIPFVLEKYPNAKVVTNQKCKEFLISLLHIADEKFMVINDNQEVSLGNKTLKFLLMPWVHWPETMVTYLIEDKILFSCDFFGSHQGTFDLFCNDKNEQEKTITVDAAKRYYAEIMMPFRSMIQGHLQKLATMQIAMIAPSHGPIYKNPNLIGDLYREWVSKDVKKLIIIAYVSMHDSTKTMVDYLETKLKEKNVAVASVNLTNADLGDIAIALIDTGGIVFASPCFHIGLHPVMQNALFLCNALRPKTRLVTFMGSFGWAQKANEQFKKTIPNISAEIIEPLLIKGLPRADDYAKLDAFADEIAKNVNEW